MSRKLLENAVEKRNEAAKRVGMGHSDLWTKLVQSEAGVQQQGEEKYE